MLRIASKRKPRRSQICHDFPNSLRRWTISICCDHCRYFREPRGGGIVVHGHCHWADGWLFRQSDKHPLRLFDRPDGVQ
jgi:hypothetical protein